MSALRTWHSVESWRFSGGDLSLRLVPDQSDPDDPEPVSLLSILGVRDPQACESALARLKDGWIVELELSDTEASIWQDNAEEPEVFRGDQAALHKAAYTADDFRRTIAGLQRALRRESELHAAARSKLAAMEAVLAGLIQRAEAKRAMTSRSTTGLDHELDLFRRIQRRLRERD